MGVMVPVIFRQADVEGQAGPINAGLLCIFGTVERSFKCRTTLGDVWVVSDDEHITRVCFSAPMGIAEGGRASILLEARDQLEAYLNGRAKSFDLPLKPKGTAYQQRVWEALCAIPYGNTTTYAQLVTVLGGGTVARAVGTACSANPLPILIPCHRVVSSTGGLAGYLGGLEWKRRLLGWSGALLVFSLNIQSELFDGRCHAIR